MNLTEFRATLDASTPPATTLPLQALWHDAKGNWSAAHDLLQDDTSPAGSWVHAYLHRKEADLPNAAYWYRRAGKPTASGDFATEWDAIVTNLLG